MYLVLILGILQCFYQIFIGAFYLVELFSQHFIDGLQSYNVTLISGSTKHTKKEKKK